MNKNNCLICSSKLLYGELKESNCVICGETFKTEVYCESGHYICDKCHKEKALKELEKMVSESAEKDPIDIAEKIFKISSFNTHGPEYHYIVPLAVLKALENNGINVNKNFIKMAMARCSLLPGGSCGMLGICSTAMGSGVTSSIFLNVNPLSTEHYKTVHKFTASAVEKISKLPGPRCCKRNVYNSIISTLKSFEKELNIKIEHKFPICTHYNENEECIKKSCPYFREET